MKNVKNIKKPIREWKEIGTCVYAKDGKLLEEQMPIVCQEFRKDKSLADEVLELLEVVS